MTIEEAAVALIRQTKNHWVNSRMVAEFMSNGEKVDMKRTREVGEEMKRLADAGVLERKRREDGYFCTLPGEGEEYIPLYVRRSMMGGILPMEIEIARRKCQIGDVFPAVVWAPNESVNTMQPSLAEVVVDYKSRHLIHCTDGHTYNYASLAMYYRNRQPLGRWER